jgi:hypothetical protein
VFDITVDCKKNHVIYCNPRTACRCNLEPTISRIVCQHSRSSPVLDYNFVDPVPDHMTMLDVGQVSTDSILFSDHSSLNLL